jgi:hypothetical protein
VRLAVSVPQLDADVVLDVGEYILEFRNSGDSLKNPCPVVLSPCGVDILLALSVLSLRGCGVVFSGEDGFQCRLVNAATSRHDRGGRVGCVVRTCEEVNCGTSLHLASMCMRMSSRRVIL